MDESEEENDETEDQSNGNGWSLLRILDVGAVVLILVVLTRAVGGVVAALGIPSPSIPIPPSDSGVVGQLNLFSVPTYVRLQYGTQWADLSSGLLLLACVALLLFPRWIWKTGPEDRGLFRGPVLLSAAGVTALLTAVAGVVGTVNALSNVPGQLDFTEALTVSTSVASVTLAGLALVLCWGGWRWQFAASD